VKLPRLDAVLAASLVSLATSTGCRDQPRPASESAQARELATPSQPDSGEPNLTVAPDGAVLLAARGGG
jgi:hypothetical protein